jgi:TorA maturation chaperone TorD
MMTQVTDRKPDIPKWEDLLTGEVLLFGLLGKALYQEPEKDWVDSLVVEQVFEDAPLQLQHPDAKQGLALLQGFSREIESGMSEQAFDELRLDYTRLFIGPGKVLAPPWESVYFSEDRLVFQEQTLQVRGWYRRFGLQAEKLYNEPDDHVGLELAFLAHLASLGLKALGEEDRERFFALLDSQRDFLSQHVLRWAPQFCEQVVAKARTEFYKGIALLTRGALFDLAGLLEVEIREMAK